jgi:hypothetical protein
VIIGSGKQGLDLAPIDELRHALRPPARIWPFPDGDVLFDCDLRANTNSGEYELEVTP